MKEKEAHRRQHVGHGGKARARLAMFQEARGITDDTAGQYSAVYTAGVLQAIALAATPSATGSPNLPQWHLVGPDLVANGSTFGHTPDGGFATTSVSGRVGAIAVDPSNRNHILCGSAAGGIWESFTRGADWAPRTDSMVTLTIGAIAFDPNNTANVYAGTGEGNKYWFLGQGMLHSTNGGTTWSMLNSPSPFTGQGFFQIIVDPADSKHILAATTSGVYQSADSGNTWSQVCPGKTWDISMVTAKEVLAATASGLQVSADGGSTWNPVALPGAPASWERLAVSITPSDSATAFAFGASTDSPPMPYLWRRSGGTWTAITPMPVAPEDQWDPAPNNPGQTGCIGTSQAHYDWYVVAARDRADQVYIGIFDAWRADLAAGTGAPTWTNLTSKAAGAAGDSIHPDQHALVVDPSDPSTIYAGCDGGLFRSPDRGISWIPLNAGLSIAEMEYLTQDNSSSTARWLLAGLQDNGSLRYTGSKAFEQVGTGDGGDCGIDQANPGTCYYSYTNMGLYKSTARGAVGTFTAIDAKKDMKIPDPTVYKCLFYPPVAVSGSTVAQAGQSVYVSRNAGATWTEVKLPLSAPPPDQYTTALYLPSADLIYAATNNGRVFSLTWSNNAWAVAELTQPRANYISAIRTDPSTPSRIWVTLSEMGGGLVYRSDDGGKNWTDKTTGTKLPQLPLNSIAIDNKNGNRVWVSADLGVYQTTDGGSTWTAFYQNLPNALITDLEFHPTARVLRAATRNRGIWEVAVDTPGSSVLAPGVQAFSALLNHTGGMESFGVLTGNTPAHVWQTAPNSGWPGCFALPGTTVTSPLAVTAVSQDKRLEAFARGPDGALWRNYQNPTGFSWSGWASLGGCLTGTPVAAVNQDGRVEVFARGPDGMLQHISQTATGTSSGWSPWASLGAVITSAPAAALNADGRLEVFARGIDGALGHISQTSAGGSSGWSAWQSLGSDVITSRPVAAVNQDGRLEVSARGSDGGLRQISQTAPGGSSGWSAWQPLGGGPIGDPAVTPMQDGRLAVSVRRTSDNSIWIINQSAPGSWTGSAWTQIGGYLNSDPVVVCNQDGRLAVFALGGGYAMCLNWQSAPNGSWPGWVYFGNSTSIGFPSS